MKTFLGIMLWPRGLKQLAICSAVMNLVWASFDGPHARFWIAANSAVILLWFWKQRVREQGRSPPSHRALGCPEERGT